MHVGMQQVMGREIGTLPPVWETQIELQPVASAWPNPDSCGHLGYKPADSILGYVNFALVVNI